MYKRHRKVTLLETNIFSFKQLIDVKDTIKSFQHIIWFVFILYGALVASSILFSMDISFLAIPLTDNSIIRALMLLATIIIAFYFFYYRIFQYRLSTTQYYISFTTLLIYTNLRFIHDTPIYWDFIYWSPNLAVLDLPFLLLLQVLINSFRKELIKKKQSNNSIYLEDTPYNEGDQSTQFENILSNLNSILFTDYFERAFTIGIIGSWGAGKSSLLNSIENKVKNHPNFNKSNILIRFSPFLNHNEDKIVQEFFNQLSNELNKKSGKLSKKMLLYAAKLSNVINEGNPLAFLKKPIPSNENESVKELYDDIIAVLQSLNIKIIVTIDDLDRLSSTEILQVLKLIRNTANFPNTIFFVALDKEYVTSALMSDKQYMKENYLDKFFQLELHVSKVNVNIIIDYTLNKILTCLSDLGLNEINQKKLNNTFKQNSLGFNLFLLHYRDAKRFANQFILDFQLIHSRDINSEEIKYHDFTALTLMKLFGTNEYRMVENRNEKLIHKSKTVHGLWMLEENRKLTEDKKIELLLNDLFPSNNKDNTFTKLQINRNSIAFDKSLRLYFERILSIEELTESEFQDIYCSNDLDSIKLRLLDLSRSSQKVIHFIEMLLDEEENTNRLFHKTIILMHAINLLDEFDNHFFSEFNRLFNLVRKSNSNDYRIIRDIALSSKDYSPIFQAKFIHIISNYEEELQNEGNNIIQVYSNQLLLRYTNTESEISFQFFFREFKAVLEELLKIQKLKVQVQDFARNNIISTNEITFLQQIIVLEQNQFQWKLDPILFEIIGDYPEIEKYVQSVFNNSTNELLEYLDFIELYAIQKAENAITYNFNHLKPIDIFGNHIDPKPNSSTGQIVFECKNGFKDLVKNSNMILDIAEKYNPKYYKYGNNDYWFASFNTNDKRGLVSISKHFQNLANLIDKSNLEYPIVGEGPIVMDKETKEVIISIRSIQPFIDLKKKPSSLEKL